MSRQRKGATKWEEHAKKRNNEPFCPFRYDVLRSPLVKKLSHRAKALLLELVSQYNGYNNGDLSASFSLMKDQGWNSSATLNEAKKELVDAELIIVTRQGGRNQCSLYGLSFFAIDECNGKLDIQSTTKASDDWKKHHYQLLNQTNKTP